MNTLVIRLVPRSNEYILGYIFRLVRSNYIKDPFDYLSQFTEAKSLRKSLRNIADKNFDLDTFSTHIKKNQETIAGLYVSEQLTNTSSDFPKICSKCYAKEGFINKDWLSPLQLICEKHLVFLASKCSNCGRVLEWHFLQFFICRTCKQPITSAEVDPNLLKSSPYLTYCLQKKSYLNFSKEDLIGIISFFLILTIGVSLFQKSSFTRAHEFSQEKILESYDNALNFFLEFNLFEDFLIKAYENTPYDIQHRNMFYGCFTNIDQYINNKPIRDKLLKSIKNCYFLKTKITNNNYQKIKSIIEANYDYHNNRLHIDNFQRESFDLVTLFQFKYITKTNASTLQFLIENSFVRVLKSENGTYQYISIYSLYRLMNLLKTSSVILTKNYDSTFKKFIDLDTEEKKDFLYSLLSGRPYKYEYDVLTGLDNIKVILEKAV